MVLLFLSCLVVFKMASSIWLHQLLPTLSFFSTSQSTTNLIFSWSIWITRLLIQWPRKSIFVWAPFRVQLLFLLHWEHYTQGSKSLPDGKTTMKSLLYLVVVVGGVQKIGLDESRWESCFCKKCEEKFSLGLTKFEKYLLRESHKILWFGFECASIVKLW